MKKILALVLALALIATLGITYAFAADVGFVDGNVSGPRFVEQADSNKAPDIINTDIP